MDLKIISCTDSPNSQSLEIANYIKSLYEKEGVHPEVISLEDFPLKDVHGGKYGEEIASVIAFRKPIINAEALLFVIPEYNGSFPGILKMFIDYLPYPSALIKKPVAFVGTAGGAFGGLRPVEQFQMVTNYLDALQFSERIFISRAHKNFDPEKGILDEFQQQLLESQTKNFISFVEALRD
jgi:NAD(P)H-dependent FMN reductase